MKLNTLKTKNMKKEQDKFDTEKLLQLMLLHSVDELKLIINIYETQLDFLDSLYQDLCENEPLKLFFKSHKLWEEKKEKLFKHILHVEDNLQDEYIELENTIEQIYGKKNEDNN